MGWGERRALGFLSSWSAVRLFREFLGDGEGNCALWIGRFLDSVKVEASAVVNVILMAALAGGAVAFHATSCGAAWVWRLD